MKVSENMKKVAAIIARKMMRSIAAEIIIEVIIQIKTPITEIMKGIITEIVIPTTKAPAATTEAAKITPETLTTITKAVLQATTAANKTVPISDHQPVLLIPKEAVSMKRCA